MMDELIKYAKKNIYVKKALDFITPHVVNKDFYYRNAYSIQKNPNNNGNYKNQNQRRSYYLDSTFCGANLAGSGFSDSIFRNTSFYDCIFDDVNLECSYFFNCEFRNKRPYKSASFAKSYIYESTFKETEFYRCRLSGMQFINSELEGCAFDNTSFDGTVFSNTTIDNVSFKNLNLEYVRFDNVHINNTALPFPTIPYIINGIKYIKDTSDNVYIKSAEKGKITKREYLDLLPHLKVYYEAVKNYFPLANIYISENDTAKTTNCISLGIQQSIFLNNYRQLKNYCILVGTCGLFGMRQKKYFINVISSELNLRLAENYSFYSSLANHLPELSDILLSSDNTSLIITFKTNIENNDYRTLSLFYQTINMIISSVGIQSNYNVNFTYSSEAFIITTINSLDTAIVVALISAVTTIFIAGIKGLSNLPEIISKFATIKSKILQEKLLLKKQDLENKKLELEIKDLENKLSNIPSDDTGIYIERLINNIKPILANCDKLKDAGVYIENVNYNAVNIDGDALTEYTSNIICNGS